MRLRDKYHGRTLIRRYQAQHKLAELDGDEATMRDLESKIESIERHMEALDEQEAAFEEGD
jgi:hypothetical protein